jgi:citrate lyase subunit beta/citryl-CoA lyase
MRERMPPHEALHEGPAALPALPACVHYAGAERYLRKALELQAAMGPRFDIAGDCEDGAPVGGERAHAQMIAGLVASTANRHGRFGARVHDVLHHATDAEIDALVGIAGDRLAFLALPKARGASDVAAFLARVDAARARHGVRRRIPVSVLIETPGAVREAFAIAALPGIVSLDFGTLDYVSAHQGAIALSAMESPGQFDHALLHRAKAEVAAAALAHGVVPAHGVTRALDDPEQAHADARRARDEFGFLRMWSIHPSQIEPIVRAFAPHAGEIAEAVAVLAAAQDADWAPLAVGGKLHDRASYRYFWSLLTRAEATGAAVPDAARAWLTAAAASRA